MSQADWTFMVYMAGDNDLSAAGEADLAEMRRVGSTDRVHVVVEFDNAGPRGTRRIHVEKDGVGEVVESLGETDSGSPTVLADFIDWTVTRYPAERYALVLWNHGTGWAPTEVDGIARAVDAPGYTERELAERSAGSLGRVFFRSSMERILGLPGPSERAICTDDGSGHSLDTLELGSVLAAAAATLGAPIDLLGMDACLMASIEVAYQIRGSVRFLVASEENEPSQGWPYDRLLARLSAQPEMSTADLAESAVTDYVAWFRESGIRKNVTQAAFDLSRLGRLTDPLGVLAHELAGGLPDAMPAIWRAQRGSASFAHATLWDIGHFCEELEKATDSETIRGAARAVLGALEPGAGPVIANDNHGGKVRRCRGLNVYLVSPLTPVSGFYGDLDFARDHGWPQMLEAYHRA